MNINVTANVYMHNSVEQKILEQLLLIIQNQKTIMADLTQLSAAVANETTVDESAITLLKGLKDQLDAAGTDPVALKALSDSLSSESQKLADAVTANTPASNPS